MLNDKGAAMIWLSSVSIVRKVFLAQAMLWGAVVKDELWNFGAYSVVLNPAYAGENIQLNSARSRLCFQKDVGEVYIPDVDW